MGRRSQIDRAVADRVVRFVNNLTHTKGVFAGEPFNLRPWQEKVVRALFGTLRPDGRRQYRTCLMMLPRKNGKSELAAALALYGLLGDQEIGAEVYSAAADKDQASLVFNVAMQMVRNDPELDAQCEIVESQRRIIHRRSGSFYRAISAEAYSKHGFNASMVIYDELHAAPDRELWDVLTTSMGARRNPVVFVPTTAGYDRHSILWEIYSHAKKVQENPALDPSFLPVIFEADREADWTSEKVWKKANPAAGDFRDIDELRLMAARAREIPAQQNAFRRLYLNQWTEQAERWLSLETWDACGGARRDLHRRRCYVGMDLSTTTDLSALIAVFPDDDGGSGFDVLGHYFVPHDNIKKRIDRDRVPYEQWVKEGHITATSGNVIDYEAIRAKLHEWREAFDVFGIAYDPWNATDLVTRLTETDGFLCAPIRQGFASLSAPTKALEKAVVSKTLRHDGDPVLRWAVSNVAVETDPAGNLKPSKKVSTERIDPVIALIEAVDLMSRNAGVVNESAGDSVMVV